MTATSSNTPPNAACSKGSAAQKATAIPASAAATPRAWRSDIRCDGSGRQGLPTPSRSLSTRSFTTFANHTVVAASAAASPSSGPVAVLWPWLPACEPSSTRSAAKIPFSSRIRRATGGHDPKAPTCGARLRSAGRGPPGTRAGWRSRAGRTREFIRRIVLTGAPATLVVMCLISEWIASIASPFSHQAPKPQSDLSTASAVAVE